MKLSPKKIILVFLVPWLLISSLGEFLKHDIIPKFSDPTDAKVIVLSASLPQPLSFVARHTWFAVSERNEPRFERWEVWQDSNVARESWGYVQKDLQPYYSGVGGGFSRIESYFEGAVAETFISCLRTNSPSYKYREVYHRWPGPNSNTYTDYMLRLCSPIGVSLPATAIGKDYRGNIGFSSTTEGTGFQIETPILGFKVGLNEGIEIQVFAVTFGIDFLKPAFKIPFGTGRFGF